ncbi:MAG: PLP-dependent aminotransferase family protein [Geminicoccaceae bacterium]|nr:PLP-dependent aminotransferase family protein [Geminicoccaceae bacterium]
MLDDLKIATGTMPRYRALALAIEEQIQDGRIAGGYRLPPQRRLAYALDVTIGTVGRAYELLIQRGLARGEVGRGTYVLDPSAGGSQIGVHGTDGGNGIVDLSTNNPIPTAACEELRGLLVSLLQSPRVDHFLANYPSTMGSLANRRAASQWLTHLGVSCPAEQIVITGGAQGGLAAALAALTRPGDGLLLEQLTYPRFASLARTFSLRPEGVAIDANGLIPEALDSACRQGRGKVLILSTSMNNPTTAMLDEARRREIARIADRHDLLLIEDDVYGPLVSGRPRPLATIAPERTVYISSVSKFLAPGQRLGIVAAPTRVIPMINQRHADLALSAPSLTAELMAHAQAHGLLEKAEILQRKAVARRQALVRNHLVHGHILSNALALHVWLETPPGLDPDQLVVRLAGEGLRIASAREFSTTQEIPRAVRISIGGSLDDTELVSAISRINHALTLPSAGAAI